MGQVTAKAGSSYWIRLTPHAQGLLPPEKTFPPLRIGESVLVQVRRESFYDSAEQGFKHPLLSRKISYAGAACVYTPSLKDGGNPADCFRPRTSPAPVDVATEQNLLQKRHETAIKFFPINPSICLLPGPLVWERFLRDLPQTLPFSRNFIESDRDFGKDFGSSSDNGSVLPKEFEGAKDDQRHEADSTKFLENGISTILVDDMALLPLVQRYCIQWRSDLVGKIDRYHGNLFEEYLLEDTYEDLFSQRVVFREGSIFIEETSLGVCIDVNGSIDQRMDTKSINLAAAETIARQLQYRSLSGPMILDFINSAQGHRREIEEALVEGLRGSSSRYQILGWSKLGWLELISEKRRTPLSQRLRNY